MIAEIFYRRNLLSQQPASGCGTAFDACWNTNPTVTVAGQFQPNLLINALLNL